MELITTASSKKAESILLKKLATHEPVMLFGDMGFLPWFDFPVEYHFGGHTFVICGFDGDDTFLASDIDPKTTGLKKGFYSPITVEQLREARSSLYKPFPAKNAYVECDFNHFHFPGPDDIYSSINQTIESMLNPPIRNLGIKGIRYTSGEILKWPQLFSETELRMNLFNIYIYFEIGGTGGGCFRNMYSRFLKEAAEITGNENLSEASVKIHDAGELYSEIGNLFKEAIEIADLTNRIKRASHLLLSIANIEENTFNLLFKAIEK